MLILHFDIAILTIIEYNKNRSIPVICQYMKINKFSDIKTYKGQHKRTYTR